MSRFTSTAMLENGKSSSGTPNSWLADTAPSNGSFVRQYPPTPNPGWRMFECVGRRRIAAIA